MTMERWKKWIAFIIIYICRLFPIKHNKIFLYSYYGAQFGCNPKYITNYIANHYPDDMFDVVWAFHDPKSKKIDDSFRKVRTMSFKYFYHLCTAKIVITNFRTTDLYIKRKNQYYIQTWHSSLRLKQIEKDVEDSLPSTYVQMAKEDSLKCDLLLSGCAFSTDIFKRAFWYDGEIFEHGTPRNDVLLQNKKQLRANVLEQLNICSDTKILLYAPTFREADCLSVYDLNYEALIKKLTNKFAGNWVVLVKLHPHLMSRTSELTDSDRVLNVTDYDDMQELLAVADVLISDYSSLMFDYAITMRPCFLYVPDLKSYITKERKLYFDVTELPFISATSNDALITQIEKYNPETYKQQVALFLQEIGTFEEGKASEYVVRRLEEVCFGEGRNEAYEAV